MTKYLQREITPLVEDDLFIILNHPNAKFDYPTHYHPDYELNLVINSNGKRVIGDSIIEFNELDLVLIGPNVCHSWMGNENGKNSHVVTIQFPETLFSKSFLGKKLIQPIKEMLLRSDRGIEFSEETKQKIKDRILNLASIQGFDSFLEFLSILHDLAISRNQRLLSSPTFNSKVDSTKSKRIMKVYDFIQDNYQQQVKLKEVADLINMTETAFSHFFKKRTQRSFSDYILEIRLGHAARMLLETTNRITEICFDCGFSNVSNFNRIFKKRKGFTPSEFRKNFQQAGSVTKV